MVAVRIRRQARRRRQAGPDAQSVEAVGVDAARLLQDIEDVLAAIDASLE
ncbi:MAG TPA: hypothetical protein VNK73_18755 [Actinomycetota bacterium]|jgi:hypothetical protein|nr:hypothetical protein [Actinomycetota bacterium]